MRRLRPERTRDVCEAWHIREQWNECAGANPVVDQPTGQPSKAVASLGGIGDGFGVVEAYAAGRRCFDERFPLAGWKFPGPDVPSAPVNNADVARKVVQSLGPAMLGEIIGRAADCNAVRSDSARHQARTVTVVAAANREIEAVFDQVHRPVAKRQLQFELGVLCGNFRQHWRDAATAEKDWR